MSTDASSTPPPLLVLIAEPLPEVALDLLRSQGVEIIAPSPNAGWGEAAADIRGLIYYSIVIDKELMDDLPALEVIGKRGTGLDTLDLDEADRRGITVVSAKGANAQAVAEHALMLLLAASRKLIFSDRLTRQGRFVSRFEVGSAAEVAGSRVGLVGLGHVGSVISRILRSGFDAEVGFFDPYVTDAQSDIRPFDDLRSLFAWSTSVVICAPLTAETRGMIGAGELELLGPEGVLVVVSRGGIVDEADLVDALTSGTIRAAGVDTYTLEPPEVDHPFFSLDNVVLTPHVAWATGPAIERASLSVCRQVVDHLKARHALG